MFNKLKKIIEGQWGSSRFTRSRGGLFFLPTGLLFLNGGRAMNEYTEKQLRNLDERIAAKKAEKEKILKLMREEADSSLNALAYYCIPAAIIGLITLIIFLAFAFNAHAEEIDVDRLANAIYKAEGGRKAQYPYGIRSVNCNSKEDCRRICKNTIRNNIKRFNKYGYKTHKDFLTFLASRYAPIGADNDPRNLNVNWLKNVRFYMGGV